MGTRTLFVTRLYEAALGGPAGLNEDLEQACRMLEAEDRAGQVLLWEAFLRHEVPANASKADRISISFNYAWK